MKVYISVFPKPMPILVLWAPTLCTSEFVAELICLPQDSSRLMGLPFLGHLPKKTGKEEAGMTRLP